MIWEEITLLLLLILYEENGKARTYVSKKTEKTSLKYDLLTHLKMVYLNKSAMYLSTELTMLEGYLATLRKSPA